MSTRRAELRASFGIHPGRRNLARGRSALYSPHLFVGFVRCGVCGGGITIVTSGTVALWVLATLAEWPGRVFEPADHADPSLDQHGEIRAGSKCAQAFSGP